MGYDFLLLNDISPAWASAGSYNRGQKSLGRLCNVPVFSNWSLKKRCYSFKDVRAKILHWFFSENFTIERWWVSDVRNVKKMGGHRADFVLERSCPEEHLNLSKSGFVSEEGHSGCKSQILQLELWREMFSTKLRLRWLKTVKYPHCTPIIPSRRTKLWKVAAPVPDITLPSPK